jgi:hypothetical protein
MGVMVGCGRDKTPTPSDRGQVLVVSRSVRSINAAIHHEGMTLRQAAQVRANLVQAFQEFKTNSLSCGSLGSQSGYGVGADLAIRNTVAY